MKKNIFGVEFIKPLTESCAEKNCNNCDSCRLQQGRFRKVLSGFQSFFEKSSKECQTLFSMQVMSNMDGDFINLGRLKNIVLESSYKAVN